MIDAVLYVSIFLFFYFQVFVLLTYVSPGAAKRRAGSPLPDPLPTAAIIVPCFNEETTIKGTVESLLNLDYPHHLLEIILVNDGSTDGTRAVMDSYADNPRIKIIHKENGGKHTAMNLGIESTNADIIGCLDADSFVDRGALLEVVRHFDSPKIAAVTASMAVHDPKNPLQRMQYAEYLAGITMRHILASVNGLYVTPGPFSFYRRTILQSVGGFHKAHNTEDMEMAMRLQSTGYIIENAARAKVYTKAPRTLSALVKQRTRWTSGFIRNAYDYRSLIGNPRYGVLGLLVLPLGLLSLVSGIGLFILTIVRLAQTVQRTINTVGDVPVAHLIQTPEIDLFYIPITSMLIFGCISIASILLTLIVGKKISGIEGKIGPDLFWNVMLYSLVSPLWVFTSLRDVILGTKRSWR